MQPSESENIHEPESQAPDEASPEATDEEASPGWWQRMTSRVFHREEPLESSEEPDPAAAGSPQRMLTQTDIDRLVQSETDRRVAAHNKALRDEERRRLRDEDPFAYADQERQQEAAQAQDGQLNELLQGIGVAHDEVTLKPLMAALEPAEYERLMQLPNAGVGGDGRKLLTTEALRSLEKRWKADGAREAEAKLRKNPTFRKQVMSEFNGGISGPELLPSGSVARGNGRSSEEVNQLLRRQLGMPTQ